MFQLSLLKKDILKDSMLGLLAIRIIQTLNYKESLGDNKTENPSDCNNSQNSKLKRFIEVHVIPTQSLELSKQIDTKCCLAWLKNHSSNSKNDLPVHDLRYYKLCYMIKYLNIKNERKCFWKLVVSMWINSIWIKHCDI